MKIFKVCSCLVLASSAVANAGPIANMEQNTGDVLAVLILTSILIFLGLPLLAETEGDAKIKKQSEQ